MIPETGRESDWPDYHGTAPVSNICSDSFRHALGALPQQEYGGSEAPATATTELCVLAQENHDACPAPPSEGADWHFLAA